jgi:hypothetical protein
MNCTICGTSINSIEEEPGQEWIPFFFEGEDEHGPLCPSCSDILICIANDGAYELKDEYKGKIQYNDQIEMESDPLYDIILGYILN